MAIYEYLSTMLTAVGYILMTYRTIFLLAQQNQKDKQLEGLSIKWIIFLLFLKFQPSLIAIFEIIPFGVLLILAVKCVLVLPENALAILIYQKLQKQLEKIEFQEYSSKFATRLSTVIKFTVIKLLSLCQKLVVYINSQQIEDVEKVILQTIKSIEYKKAAVSVRSELGKSGLRRQLHDNQVLNESVDSIDLQEIPVKHQQKSKKSEIGERMSKILYDDEVPNPILKTKLKVLINPKKQKGQLPIYEQTSVEFNSANKQVIFVNKLGARQKDKLTEIRYVSKNMMTLELVLGRNPSKVVKLLKQQDVITWMKPIVQVLTIPSK